jgi:hypothetical protein
MQSPNDFAGRRRGARGQRYSKPIGSRAPLRLTEPGAQARHAFDEVMSRQLQSVYREILNEPVPERFLRLLDKLDADEGGS